MNIPSLTFVKRISLFALVILAMAVAGSAQKAGRIADVMMAPPNLDQCENGRFGTTRTECNWVNGNLNAQNSQWTEGDFVPYRMVITDATTSIIVGYDTTENGRHTFDYLGDYNEDVAQAAAGIDPCEGITVCVAGPNTANDDIDLDTTAQAGPDQILGTADDLTIPAGSFSIWNGTITSVTFNGYTGDFSGTSQASYTINFTPDGSGNPVVIAWSGHISTRDDWGVEFSAVAINGSSYHMRNLTSGNQDRSLKIEGETFPARITIIKQIGDDPTLTSEIFFGFDRSDVLGSPNFFLKDDYTTAYDPTDPTRTDGITFEYSLANNATLSVNITELIQNVGFGWDISGLQCVDASGGLGSTPNSTPQPGLWDGESATATINLQTSEFVTCTFENLRTGATAAPVQLGGRVTNALGRAIANADVILTDTATGETRYARTNTFGYYLFDNVSTTAFYSLTVSAKRYRFPEGTQYFTLSEDNLSMNFSSSN